MLWQRLLNMKNYAIKCFIRSKQCFRYLVKLLCEIIIYIFSYNKNFLKFFGSLIHQLQIYNMRFFSVRTYNDFADEIFEYENNCNKPAFVFNHYTSEI